MLSLCTACSKLPYLSGTHTSLARGQGHPSSAAFQALLSWHTLFLVLTAEHVLVLTARLLPHMMFETVTHLDQRLPKGLLSTGEEPPNHPEGGDLRGELSTRKHVCCKQEHPCHLGMWVTLTGKALTRVSKVYLWHWDLQWVSAAHVCL